MLMVGALIGILKPTPAAHVIDEDGLEVGLAGFDLGHQFLECLAPVQSQTRSARVFKDAKDG